MLVDKEIPLYYQLETILRKRILSGEFAPDVPLPSEESLGKEYEVSRITVRRALSALEQERLISRKRGKGTFVSEKFRSLDSPRLSGFIEDIISMGIKTRTKVIDISWVEAPENVKERLNLQQQDQTLRIEKVRLIKGSSFSHVFNYLPPDIGQNIPSDKLTEKPLLMILEDDLDIRADTAIQTVEATIADAQVATLLGIRVGEPLLKVERTVFDVKQKPVEYVSALYRADKYFYTVNLKRKRSKNSVGWGPI
jgi:GntR family transcriptional regulator